ncbi:MAG: CidA/LrgA family protein [Pacificimonas sp.]
MKQAGNLVFGLVIVALFALAGDLIVIATGLPVPPSVMGLILFATALAALPALRRIVAAASELLTGLLGAFIVPLFVGLWLFRTELAEHWLPIGVVLLVTTPLTGLAAILAYRLAARR